MLFKNTCRDILKIAEQMMLGELEYHEGNHDAAFDQVRWVEAEKQLSEEPTLLKTPAD